MSGPVIIQNPDGTQVLSYILLHYGRPQIDKPIFDAIEAAKHGSGMDEMRLIMLWRCVLATKQCPHGALIEVGCGRGGSGLVIAKARTFACITEDVHLVDTFTGIVGSGEIDFHKDGEMDESSPEETTRFLQDNREPACVWKTVYPDQSIPGPYRFAHIDVDTYKSTSEAIDFLIPKMVSGGIMVIDDYGVESTKGVTNAVDERANWSEVRWIFPPTRQAIAVVL